MKLYWLAQILMVLECLHAASSLVSLEISHVLLQVLAWVL